MAKTVLITGANRGIGLELAHQYLNVGWTVLACCREPGQAQRLSALVGEDLEIFPLDVRDPQSIAALAAALRERPIDVVINNAGIAGPREGQRLGALADEAWLDVLSTNTLGPARVAEALLENLARSDSPVLVTLSSVMGSIANNDSGGYYAYRSSKAAVNAVMKSMATDLRARGITVLLVHPGWVRTDMGGPQATISVEESAAGIREVIDEAKPEASGSFVDYTGAALPW
jgi:NAD(P)-dependent dehydrogenase (short-subunit alcohol dehydrogenase family)